MVGEPRSKPSTSVGRVFIGCDRAAGKCNNWGDFQFRSRARVRALKLRQLEIEAAILMQILFLEIEI